MTRYTSEIKSLTFGTENPQLNKNYIIAVGGVLYHPLRVTKIIERELKDRMEYEIWVIKIPVEIQNKKSVDDIKKYISENKEESFLVDRKYRPDGIRYFEEGEETV